MPGRVLEAFEASIRLTTYCSGPPGGFNFENVRDSFETDRAGCRQHFIFMLVGNLIKD